MKNTIRLASILATLFVPQVNAAEMFQCVDASGHLTFVQHHCPNTSTQITERDANSLPPSGAGTPTLMADPVNLDVKYTHKLTVVESGPEPKAYSPPNRTQAEREARIAGRKQRIEQQRRYDD